MTENEIGAIIVDCAFKVHVALGPGLLESIYEMCLAYEIQKRGLEVRRQTPIKVKYDDMIFDEGFRADLLIENKVMVELKSKERLNRADKKQILSYIRLADKKLGYLLNFGETRIKDGITRFVNGLEE
mgnify:CR=1 FL=1